MWGGGMKLTPVPTLKRDGAVIAVLRFIPVPDHAHAPSVVRGAPASVEVGAGVSAAGRGG
jgi:hypothetical protein